MSVDMGEKGREVGAPGWVIIIGACVGNCIGGEGRDGVFNLGELLLAFVSKQSKHSAASADGSYCHMKPFRNCVAILRWNT